MPRVKGAKVNKSEEIRQVLASDPKLKAKAVVALLESRGIKVSPNQVYFVKTTAKARSRKARRMAAVGVGRRAGASDPVALVLRVKELAQQTGGVQSLKRLVDALAE